MRATLPSDIQALGQTALFRGCSKRALRRVQRYGTTLDLPAGRVLWDYAGRADQLLVILSGEVVAAARDGRYRILGAGDWCGRPGAGSDVVMDLEAVETITPATVFAVSRREFGSLCDACPQFASRMGCSRTPVRIPQSRRLFAGRLSPVT